MTDQAASPLKPLTQRERKFVAVYVTTWNASEAARQARYANESVAGSRNMAKPQVQAAIEEMVKQAGLGPNEVLARLAQQATVNPAEFMFFEMQDVIDANGNLVIEPKTGLPQQRLEYAGINWAVVIRKGYLIKGIERDRRGNLVLKFHDAQNALIHIGKHLKLFSEQIDLNMLTALKAYVGVSPDDWDDDPAAGNGQE